MFPSTLLGRPCLADWWDCVLSLSLPALCCNTPFFRVLYTTPSSLSASPCTQNIPKRTRKVVFSGLAALDQWCLSSFDLRQSSFPLTGYGQVLRPSPSPRLLSCCLQNRIQAYYVLHTESVCTAYCLNE